MDDHDLLVRIDERMGRVQEGLTEIKETLSMHDKRLSALERWRAYVLGAAAVVAILISIIVGLLQ